MFEQEAPKWFLKLFNDADSNTIHVGSQKGLSYDSNTIKKPPSELGSVPIKRVPTAMFSLVRIRPMFEQEAPKWPYISIAPIKRVLTAMLDEQEAPKWP